MKIKRNILKELWNDASEKEPSTIRTLARLTMILGVLWGFSIINVLYLIFKVMEHLINVS